MDKLDCLMANVRRMTREELAVLVGFLDRLSDELMLHPDRFVRNLGAVVGAAVGAVGESNHCGDDGPLTSLSDVVRRWVKSRPLPDRPDLTIGDVTTPEKN